MKFPVLSALLIAAVCHTHALLHYRIPQHHKVRHKHNLMQLRNRHVNEIREAFDDYKNSIQKPKVNFEDALKVKFRHEKKNKVLSDGLTETAVPDRLGNGETAITADTQSLITRYKRVQATETTTLRTTTSLKFSDNYDEEYDDDEDDKTTTVNDDSSVKVQETETVAQSLTDYKIESLGTREGVHRSFNHELRNPQKNQQEIASNYDQATIFKMIRENMMRTKIDGMCRWPNKKVIEVPQHSSKVYSPRKYVIHQCSDDTACCGSMDKTCVAKRSTEVLLWFHVKYVGSTGYESLKVQNHTECECVYKNRQISSQSRSPLRVSHALPRTTTTRRPRKQCSCPLHYEAITHEGSCSCECSEGRSECQRRFEGKEGFTISDQRCITSRQCSEPHCLYGTYVKNTGRCPDRNDKIRRGFQRPK